MGRYSEALQKIEEERKKKGLDPFQTSSEKRNLVFRNYAIWIFGVLVVVLAIVYIHGVRKGMHLANAPVLDNNAAETQKPLNEMAASEGNTALLDNLDRMMKMSYEAKLSSSPSSTISAGSTKVAQQNKTDFYTIQLASYQDIARAREEANKLNQAGYRAIILRGGKYFSVCVDKIDDKTQANMRLAEVKTALGETTYPGAWVRSVKAKNIQPQAPTQTA